MSLEQEISQEKFSSEYQKASINILFTSNWLYTAHANYLKAFNITPEQFNVLRILRGSHPKPLMLAEITCRMLDKNSNSTRLVEKLRVKGLIERTLCADNRRQVDITITQKGLALLEAIDLSGNDWMDCFEQITEEEARNLNTILDKLRGATKK
jgi:DNA-binding MarR family transcriptional regulator